MHWKALRASGQEAEGSGPHMDPARECADNKYYRNMSADKIRKAAADRIRRAGRR